MDDDHRFLCMYHHTRGRLVPAESTWDQNRKPRMSNKYMDMAGIWFNNECWKEEEEEDVLVMNQFDLFMISVLVYVVDQTRKNL